MTNDRGFDSSIDRGMPFSSLWLLTLHSLSVRGREYSIRWHHFIIIRVLTISDDLPKRTQNISYSRYREEMRTNRYDRYPGNQIRFSNPSPHSNNRLAHGKN
jgi:hypothetical protein